MALRPMIPQTPARIEWDEQICRILEEQGMTTGDAQGLMEVYGTESDQWFAAGMAPSRAADLMCEPQAHVTIRGQTYSLDGDSLMHYPTHDFGAVEWSNPTEVDPCFLHSAECKAARSALVLLNEEV